MAHRLRIGVFGGAFDPPHNAHLALVRAALSQLALDVLHVCPTGQAWHKARALSPAADRLAMTRLAFAGLPGVVVDDRELRRSGPTFTIDTLNELRAIWPQAQLHLIVGSDQARTLPTWHRWREILEIATIFVAVREETTLGMPDFSIENGFPGVAAGRLQPLHLPALDISATLIRQRVADGLGIGHLVPEGVARYIEHHHLYLAS